MEGGGLHGELPIPTPHIDTQEYTRTHAHMRTHAHTRAHAHTHVHTHMHTRRHMHIHTHTRAHMHMRAHTHTPLPWALSLQDRVCNMTPLYRQETEAQEAGEPSSEGWRWGGVCSRPSSHGQLTGKSRNTRGPRAEWGSEPLLPVPPGLKVKASRWGRGPCFLPLSSRSGHDRIIRCPRN